ncbi:MAG: hypothetical protein WCG03_00075 [Kiritimatiellales bacterium]
MKNKWGWIFVVLFPFLTGCVRLYETPLLPLNKSQIPSDSVTVRLSGFGMITREVVGSSIGFSSATASGTAYNYKTGNMVGYNASGSGTSSSLQFGDKQSEDVFMFTRNELECAGLYLQAQYPDFVLEGTLGGPYTKFNHNFWLEAPFVIGTIFTYYSLPSEGWCDLRVYDSSGRFLKSYHAEELRLYRQIGIPYFSVFNKEAMSPFARRRVIYSAVNNCLNQFFTDLQQGKIKPAQKDKQTETVSVR